VKGEDRKEGGEKSTHLNTPSIRTLAEKEGKNG